MIRMVVVDQLVENVPNVLVRAVEELVLETPFDSALVPAQKKLVTKVTKSRRQSRLTSHEGVHEGGEGGQSRRSRNERQQDNSLHAQAGSTRLIYGMSIFTTFSGGK